MRRVWSCASAARAGSHRRAPWRSRNALPSHTEHAREGKFPTSQRCNCALLFRENILGVLALESWDRSGSAQGVFALPGCQHGDGEGR